MVTLSEGKYGHVAIDTRLNGKKAVDVAGLCDPAADRARLVHVEGMPMFVY